MKGVIEMLLKVLFTEAPWEAVWMRLGVLFACTLPPVCFSALPTNPNCMGVIPVD
jgi:hypothetical protein